METTFLKELTVFRGCSAYVEGKCCLSLIKFNVKKQVGEAKK